MIFMKYSLFRGFHCTVVNLEGKQRLVGMPPYGKEAMDSIYNYLKERGVAEDKIEIPSIYYEKLESDDTKPVNLGEFFFKVDFEF
jgi:hypothetical protein